MLLLCRTVRVRLDHFWQSCTSKVSKNVSSMLRAFSMHWMESRKLYALLL